MIKKKLQSITVDAKITLKNGKIKKGFVKYIESLTGGYYTAFYVDDKIVSPSLVEKYDLIKGDDIIKVNKPNEKSTQKVCVIRKMFVYLRHCLTQIYKKNERTKN